MENIVIIAVLTVIISLAALYVYKSKKSGKKCIGCPYSCSCSCLKNDKSCSCHDKENN